MGGGAAPLHIATYTLTASLRAEQRPKGRGGPKVRGAKNTQSRNADATLNAKTNFFADLLFVNKLKKILEQKFYSLKSKKGIAGSF